MRSSIVKQLLLVLAGSLLLLQATHSQETGGWKITLNKKTVIKGDANTPDTNFLRLTKADLSNNNIFRVSYDNKAEQKGWQRSIAVFDSVGTAVVQRDSVYEFALYNKDLLGILWPRKKVDLFTWSAPLDKGMAAAIRIKRLKLCTIVLID